MKGGGNLDIHLYAYKVPKSAYISDTRIDEFTDFNEFAYWKNHQELYMWFEDLWAEKGGVRTDFNCEFVVVTREDIFKLIDTLPFENKEWDEEDKLFCMNTLEAIKEGWLVVFSPSW